ncbi:hypothetical protein BDZ89DRAFT_1135245 [Hymenopellis radicata]|nr:hypothetical protein BDZ89DRAFT_1135245 [Hymenopellis radicata]
MGSLCLSSLSILRCAPLTRVENLVLIIPPALEIIFSTSLIVTNWGTGWRHLLLVFDSWSYLLLALLDLLSHIIPAVRDNLSVFSTVDIFLGAASFIPLLSYTLFIFLFTSAELLTTLPRRFRTIAQTMLFLFIPAIVILNEIASLAGISRMGVGGRIFIGFKNDRDHDIWQFFTSMTLALHTAYQAINFSFAFFRLIKAFLNQRDLEAASSDQGYLFKGTGWISGGLKLGAIETVIGFAHAGFGGAITRRILRLLSHACISIGVVKGLDTIENFGEFQRVTGGSMQSSPRTPRGRRISHPRVLISNPRLSTFRQLSPSATEFHTTPRATSATNDRGIGPRATTGLGLAQFTDLKTQKPAQRVTIHFAAGAPKLQMRFSALDMPSPATIADSVKSRPDLSEMNDRLSEYYRSTISERMSKPDISHSRGVSQFTTDSSIDCCGGSPVVGGARFSSEDLREKGRAPIRRRLSQLVSVPEADEGLPRSSGERKRATKYHVPAYMNSRRYSATTTSETPGMTTAISDGATTQPTTPVDDEGYQETAEDEERAARLRDVPSQWLESTNSGVVERYRKPSAVSFISSRAYNISIGSPQHARERTVSWVQSPYDDSVITQKGADPLVRAIQGKHTSLTRIKSMGKAPKKYTPSPMAHPMRGSIHIEPIMIPPRAPAMVGVEAVQGSDAGSMRSWGRVSDGMDT